MSYEPRLVFLNSKTLGQPNSLESIIATIQMIGYSVSNVRVGNYREQFGFWSEYDQQTQCELGIAYEKRQLSFEAKNELDTLEVSLQLHWEESRGIAQRAHVSVVSFQTALFSRTECNPEYHSRLFLDLGKSLYKVLLPDFGWSDVCEPAGYTWYDDVQTLAVPHLYWANFFSPPYVARIGREKIMSAPAWSIEELPDGGLLYVLASYPGLADDHVPLDDVRSHFGVAQVR
jgi:hypothetical protein